MITRRTKIQLLFFVLITLIGVSYVGARYARLDRVIVDDAYTVVAHFEDSGGIFAGGEVTYRGVRIGQVEKLELTDSGVDVYLDIENGYDEIPADALALVGNRSAVGEQYVELQPQTDGKPYLQDDGQIPVENTALPIRTDTLLTDISNTVESVDKTALTTTIEELGLAFGDTGDDLQKIIDTGNSFIQTADENFDVTTALIEDSNTVLRGQIASESALRNFATQLSLFSGTLADADPDLRRVIDSGSFAANQLRTFLEANDVQLSELIRDLVTTGEIIVKHLPGIQQVLVVYPYVVEGGFTVVSRTSPNAPYDAHFGLILSSQAVCTKGYEGTVKRPPRDGGRVPMNEDARCDEPATKTNARGAQHAPQRAPANYESPVVATYDQASGRLSWGADEGSAPVGSVAPASLGEESWKWLYLQPLTARP
jgi:phospholipid/cholesterol/gamma-HCH transport system substrate-binding protein